MVGVEIDTSVLIAAVTNPGGDSARVVRLWREGRVEVVASEATLREAELVLGGGWLARLRPGGGVGRLLGDLRGRSGRGGGGEGVWWGRTSSWGHSMLPAVRRDRPIAWLDCSSRVLENNRLPNPTPLKDILGAPPNPPPTGSA